MRKYLALGLLSSLLLTSCSVDWNDAKEKRINEKIDPIVQVAKPINKINSGAILTENMVTTETSTTFSGASKIEAADINHSPFVLSLMNIEKNGITVPLIDEKEFNNFVNDNSGSSFIGNEEDWKRALSLPCESASGKNIKVYSKWGRNFDVQEDALLGLEWICMKDISDNDSLEEFLKYLHEGIKKEFTSSELNPERLKSNLDPHPLKPRSPLERLLSSQYFYGNSVTRFVTAKPYKNEILMIYINSQESGIGYYQIVRVYLKDGKLYIKENIIDPIIYKEYNSNTPHDPLAYQFAKMLNPIYGTDFKNKLETEIYDVATDREEYPIKDIDSEEVKLLKGDWLKNPSIVNKKIEERLIKDLQNLINK